MDSTIRPNDLQACFSAAIILDPKSREKIYPIGFLYCIFRSWKKNRVLLMMMNGEEGEVSFSGRHEEGPIISEYLQEDHKRLDNLLDMSFLYLKGRSREKALSCFIEFDDGLRRHIRMEDQVLFPIFEEKSGVRSGPTVVMRMEHRRIEELLGRMREEIEGLADDFAPGALPPRLAELRREILEVLGPHNAKEERILYPACDQVVSDRFEVIRKMESIT